MFTQFIKQASAQGIQAGSVATVQIPTTGTQYALFLVLINGSPAPNNVLTVAQMKAAIAGSTNHAVLYHNGEQIMEFTATFMLDLQKYYFDAYTSGAANVAGVIPIYFAPGHFNNFAERRVFAVGTQDIQSIVLNIPIVSTSVLANINVFSEVSPEVRNRGQFLKIKCFPQSYATTGLQQIVTLPLEGATVGYKALHIELGTNPGVIDYVTVDIGNYAIWDTIEVPLHSVKAQLGRRTPQAAYYHVDFGVNNDISAFLPMANIQYWSQSIQWTTTPTTFNIWSEEYFGLQAPKAAAGSTPAQT